MKSEFLQLVDLAQKHGISYFSILETVRNEVAEEYRRLYPNDTSTFTILVDEQTGDIHLISGKADITPKEFAPQAAGIARQTILRLISTKGKTSSDVLTAKVSFVALTDWVMRIIFWGYNCLYILGSIIFLLGLSDSYFRQGIWEVIRSLGFAKTIVLLIALTTPLISVVTAVRKRVAGQGGRLAALLFLFEIPVVFFGLLLVSLIVAPPKVLWLAAIIFATVPLTIYFSLFPSKEIRLRWHLIYFGSQVWTFLVSCYIFVLSSFFLPVIGVLIFKGVFGYGYFGDIWYELGRGSYSLSTLIFLPFQLGITLLFILVPSIVLLLPGVIMGIVAAAFLRTRKELILRIGRLRTNQFTLALAGALLLLTAILSYQPTIQPYLTQLTTLQSLATFEERETVAQQLLTKEQTIRQALLDMYNARSHYLFSKDYSFLSEVYREAFGVNEATGDFIQGTFNLLAYPFVYWGPTNT